VRLSEGGAELPRTRGRTLLIALAFAVPLLVNCVLLLVSVLPEPRVPLGDEVGYLTQAQRFVAGSPWALHPFWPPLYFQLVAGVFSLGGGTLALQLVQLAMLGGIAVLVADITTRVSTSRAAGLIAGWLTLSYPPLAAFAHYFWPELLHLLLFLAALWLLLVHPKQLGWLALVGMLLGFAVATKYILVPFLPFLLVPVLRAPEPLRSRLLRLGIMVVTFVTTLVITTPADQEPLLVRATASPLFNLWVGLNDTARRDFQNPVAGVEWTAYSRSAASYAERNRVLSDKITRFFDDNEWPQILWQQLSRQYFRLFDKDSCLSNQLPRGLLFQRHYGYVEAPPMLGELLRWSSYLLYSFLLVTSALGCAVVPLRGRAWLKVMLGFVAYNLLLFFFLHVKSRYRIQLLPVLLLYSSCATVWACHRLGLVRQVPSWWREQLRGTNWLLVSLGAATLLLLAWAGPWLG